MACYITLDLNFILHSSNYKSIFNSFVKFVFQILLFVNSQNNMGRKKDLISNSLANSVSKNQKNSLTKRRAPLNE